MNYLFDDKNTVIYVLFSEKRVDVFQENSQMTVALTERNDNGNLKRLKKNTKQNKRLNSHLDHTY